MMNGEHYNIDELNFKSFKNLYDKIIKACEEFVFYENGPVYDYLELNEESVKENSVEFKIVYRGCQRGCCGDESSWYEMPIDFIFNREQFKRIDTKKKEEEKRLKEKEVERKRAAELKRIEKEKEEKDLAEFERLKEKYGR